MSSIVKSGGGAAKQEKTVTAGTYVKEVLPDTGKLLSKVVVNPTPTEEKTVTPTTSQQTVSPSEGKHLAKVIVNAMEDVTPEVTAQTPIIAEIAENLGIAITTPSGTNKQILQGNNANLQLIAGYEPPSIKPVTWAGGTDEEIVAMVAAADAGIIKLSDYWAVGDIRTVHLSAMAATGVGESHAEQDVQLVLMHASGYELADGSTCNFVVGQKDSLVEKGYINSTATNDGSWYGSKRRTWCNSVYKNAMPSTLLPIFKQFKTITAQTYNGSTNQTSVDYFALPAEKEIFGSKTYSNDTEFNSLFQFDWYKTSANRIKKLGSSGRANIWFERSPSYISGVGTNQDFCVVQTSGSPSHGSAAGNRGLAPFGCI